MQQKQTKQASLFSMYKEMSYKWQAQWSLELLQFFLWLERDVANLGHLQVPPNYRKTIDCFNLETCFKLYMHKTLHQLLAQTSISYGPTCRVVPGFVHPMVWKVSHLGESHRSCVRDFFVKSRVQLSGNSSFARLNNEY